ncbi:glycosyl hydrolase, partial [Streptomyces sp. NPDC005009]
MTTAPWRDPTLPATTRVDDLLSRMTLEEKTAQLYGVWVGADTDGGGVAPHQHDMTADHDWDELITLGLGQITRSYGTAPVDPGLGARAQARAQRESPAPRPYGIPAGAPAECEG